LTFGQNILFLKNGDKINGKLEEYKSDTITFRFQGNSVKFNVFNVSSIYFDENFASKNLSIPTMELGTKQEGRVFGVVTYFFNYNFGDKPDIGAKVYIVDSAKIPNFNKEVVDSFLHASFYKAAYFTKYQKRKVNPKDTTTVKEIKKYNVDNDVAFSALDKRAGNNIDIITESEIAIKTVVDGNGNYSIKTVPGVYYVLIVSNNRKSNILTSVTECLGKMEFKKIVLKEGEEKNISCNFGLY
jgi:hypothetical protein